MLFPASKVSVSFIEAERENLHVDCRDEARSEKSQEEGRVEGRKKGSSPFLFLPSLTCDFSTYSSNVGLRGRNVQIFITVEDGWVVILHLKRLSCFILLSHALVKHLLTLGRKRRCGVRDFGMWWNPFVVFHMLHYFEKILPSGESRLLLSLKEVEKHGFRI